MSKNQIIKILAIFILVFILCSFLYVNISIGASDPLSGPIKNPEDWKPTIGDDPGLTDKAGSIYAVISTIGIIIAALALAGIGIKYMLGSVEEKAEYKKSMMPYIIGILLLGLATSLPVIINNFTDKVLK